MRAFIEDLMAAVSRKRRESVALLAVVLLDVAILVAAHVPLTRHVARLEAKAGSLSREARVLHEESEAQQALAARVHTALSECARFRSEVAGTKDEHYLPFKKALESVVAAPAISFSTNETKTGFITQEASLAIDANYSRVRQVLWQLMTSPQFLIVDRISLSAARERGGSRASLSVSTVFSSVPTATPEDPLASMGGGGRPGDGTGSGSGSPGKAAPASGPSGLPAPSGSPAPPSAPATPSKPPLAAPRADAGDRPAGEGARRG